MSNPSSTSGDWQVVWIKAVARAWKDAEFEKELVADPRAALAKHFDFTVPAGIELKVVPSPEPKESYESAASLGIPRMDIVLPLPAKPADVSDHAVALSDLVSWYGNADNCGQPCI